MKTGARNRRGGFTLIELMLVISIILLLVMIMAVAVRPNPSAAAAVQRMNTLSAALDAWHNVFGVYPPSYHSGPADRFGAQKLYYYLKGPNETGWKSGDNMVGVIGVLSAEYTWEGAMNVSPDWVTTPTGYGGYKYFNDGIQGGDRAILYYRAAWLVGQATNANGAATQPPTPLVSTTSSIGLPNYYNYHDNLDPNASYNLPGTNTDSPFWPEQGTNPDGITKQQQWSNEVVDWTKTNLSSGGGTVSTATAATYNPPYGNVYPQRQSTYTLISAGLDREFGLPTDQRHGWASDDITNFTP